jgi:nitroreductase
MAGQIWDSRRTELDEVVRERRSTRLFLRDKPVPRELLDEALSLAMRAPSNSNVQPWRVFIASGPRRDRLVEALLEAASVELPVTTGLCTRPTHRRSTTTR